MNLQRWLQLTTAGLAVLGALFLVLTGDQTWFPYALGLAAVVALVVTDWYGWVQVPRGLGNLAALLSVAWTFREFMRLTRDREAQLLTISHMLIYLQVVLVFQLKSRRVHWQLLVLSVLQVVVAAALAMGPQFGLLLTIYMATAIASMILLCYQRDVVDEDTPRAPAKSATSLHRLLDPPRQQSSTARQLQLEHWVRGPWLARNVLMITLGSLVFTLVFFFTAPRLSEAVWQMGRGRSTVSGFSGDVVLQTSGNLKFSDQPVMRVSFVNPQNNRAMQLTAEPYFHGQVLNHYQRNEQGGRWSYRDDMRTRGLSVHVSEAKTPDDFVKQEIVLDGVQAKSLFAMFPVIRLPETPSWVDDRKRVPRLLRNGNEEQLSLLRELRYAIGTLAIHNGRQLPAIPHYNPGNKQDFNDFVEDYRKHREFDATRFPQIQKVADEVIHSQRIADESHLMQALALRNHLFISGKYHYALQFDGPEENATETEQDPLEHFIGVSHRGHCELFASALVMMLRSQGIPARLVVGYKGGDWNAVGHYYLVRQKHAHAWVEVLLTADELSPDEIAGKPSGSGAWYRLDPTPASSEEEAALEKANLATQVHDIFDYADYLWRDYVLGLNSGRQDSVLEPITSRSREMFPAALDGTAWQRWLQKSLRSKDGSREMAATASDSPGSGGPPWFKYALLLGLMTVAPAAAGGLLLAVRWYWQQRRSAKRESIDQAPDFFVELTRILARRGIKVPPQATARDMANLAGEWLVLPTAVLDPIVDCYHRVRFGGVPLSQSEQHRVTHALGELSRAQLRSSDQPRPATSAVS
ncbi:transglutaminase TgpA family protein [Anatilimnocola floriformis]|uniref:transglutaminase TgpA family protein n=1 Tax=Anatilimnocola floriformis TaxID=2948575 RepID=UPI0020C3B12A|nr:DUF3488 and transglutaminase-like domain-containing protein [Anatilimnocola floriformis]